MGILFPSFYDIMESFDFQNTVNTTPIDPFEYHPPSLLARVLVFVFVCGGGWVSRVRKCLLLAAFRGGETHRKTTQAGLAYARINSQDRLLPKWIQTMILYVIRGLIRTGLLTWRAYQAAHMHTNSCKTEGMCFSMPDLTE